MPVAKLKRIRELPTIPDVLKKLFEVIQDEESTFHDIAEVISHDPSITERILRIANASYFGHSGKVKTIEQAVMLLGMELVKGIALGAVAFNVGDEKARAVLRNLWKHSCEVAVIAARLFKHISHEDVPAAFVSGLLHDIGRIAILTVEDNGYIEMLSRGCYLEDEVQAFGIGHEEAGQVFLRDAKLPEELKTSVSSHHSALTELDVFPRTVALSEALSAKLFPKPECDGRWDEGLWEYLNPYGLDPDSLEEFGLVCRKDADFFDTLFG
ncbi:MAG: HDOD domain-containing protein [Nitrospirae bacterium]|nr:MAG: HDOD domain-containing protein [Nitrospirota bacterium]